MKNCTCAYMYIIYYTSAATASSFVGTLAINFNYRYSCRGKYRRRRRSRRRRHHRRHINLIVQSRFIVGSRYVFSSRRESSYRRTISFRIRPLVFFFLSRESQFFPFITDNILAAVAYFHLSTRANSYYHYYDDVGYYSFYRQYNIVVRGRGVINVYVTAKTPRG